MASLILPIVSVHGQTQGYFFSFHISVGSDFPLEVQAVQIIQAQLKNIGINMIIDTPLWSVIQTEATTDTRTYSQGGTDAYFGPCEMDDAPDMASWFAANNIPSTTTGGNNWEGFNNAVSDQLLDEARAELNTTAQLQLYYQWQKYFLDQMPTIGVYEDPGVYLFSSQISDAAIKFATTERLSISDPTWVLQQVEIPNTTTLIYAENFPDYFFIPTLGWSYNGGCFLTLTKTNATTLQTGPGIICQSYEWAPNMTQITFHLTPNMKWSDGVPFTSEDVKYTYEAIMSPDTGAAYHSNLADISSIETPDNLTVVINLNGPDPILLQKLSRYGGMEIVPEHTLKDIPFAQWATSSYDTTGGLPSLGPWTFVNYVDGQYYKYQRNPYYYAEFGYPKMETLIQQQIMDKTTALSALEKNEVQFLDTFYYWEPDIATLKNTAGVKIGIGERLDLYSIFLNENDPVFTNAWVRKAIAYAVPGQQIINTLLGGYGNLTSIPYPVGFYARDPTLEPGYYAFDLNKAKQCMVTAGYNYDWLAQTTAGTPYSAYAIGIAIGAVVVGAAALVVSRVRPKKTAT